MNTEIKANETALEEVTFAQRAFEVEVLRLEELFQRPRIHDLTKPQRIHFHALLLVEKGSASHGVDFESYPAEPGHLFVIPAMHVQAFAPERNLQGSMIIFTPRFLADCDRDVRQIEDARQTLFSAGPHIPLDKTSFQRMQKSIHMLDQQTQNPTTPYSDRAIVSAFSLTMFTLAGLPEVVAAGEANQPRDPLVLKFQQRLEADFTLTHQATHYAKALHVSLRTLDRHLMAARSQTTRQAISSRLILEAKRLLTRREMYIKNIAYDLGFSEPQNFTRFFRTHTGTSPETFRRMLDK
ncbi:helix-turn-helix transcriptional regulator [Kiritimatiellota bacterium B12222]|nr:helix-turn-helix transcriptional regulator [Kiritimatiellota bacterium B12222]